MTINPPNKLELSPEARHTIKLPLEADEHVIRDTEGNQVCRIALFGWRNQTAYEVAAFIAALVNEALTPAAAANEPGRLCEYDDCDQLALPGDDWCAEHKAEHDQLMLETVEPETTIELSQLITTEFESATLAAQWDAASILRREG